MNTVRLESYFQKVMKDLAQGEEKQRKVAASFLRDKIKAKARKHRVTGNYEKAVYVKHLKTASFVGSKAPHAYLVEFGTAHSRPTPIVYGTFQEEAGEVERIMSEPWVK